MKRLVIGHGLVVIGFLMLLTACAGNIEYTRFVSIPSEKWNADSVAHFDFTISDTSIDYQVLIYLRHTEKYPYQNMWLFVDDNGFKDTIEFYLADDRGQWLGNKHHGFVEMPVLFEEARHYPDTGAYTMRIAHGMRDSLLRGVTDIGVEIRRNGKE